MTDVTISIPTTISEYGDVFIDDAPQIVDSFGEESFYCNTCKETILVGSTHGPRTDWEFV